MSLIIEDNKTDLIYDEKYRGHFICGNRHPRIEIRHKTKNGYYLLMKVEYDTKNGGFKVFLNSGSGSIGFNINEFEDIQQIALEASNYINTEMTRREKLSN